jgi:hypothetical protein
MKPNQPIAIFTVAIIVLIATSACEREVRELDAYTIVATDSGTVFSETKEQYIVVYDSTAQGIFVKSIDSVSQTNRAYWIYEVNSKPANIASNRYRVEPGDTVRWRLVKVY